MFQKFRISAPSSLKLKITALSLAAVMLQACSSLPTVAPADFTGNTQTEVLQKLGEPKAIYQAGNKSHWFYDVGADRAERQVIVFNSSNTVEEVRSAWTREAFESVVQRQSGSLELLHEFGPPLHQGQQSAGLLQELSDKGLGTDPNQQRSYWLYAIKEHGQHFNVLILLDAQNRASRVDISKDALSGSQRP